MRCCHYHCRYEWEGKIEEDGELILVCILFALCSSNVEQKAGLDLAFKNLSERLMKVVLSNAKAAVIVHVQCAASKMLASDANCPCLRKNFPDWNVALDAFLAFAESHDKIQNPPSF